MRRDASYTSLLPCVTSLFETSDSSNSGLNYRQKEDCFLNTSSHCERCFFLFSSNNRTLSFTFKTLISVVQQATALNVLRHSGSDETRTVERIRGRRLVFIVSRGAMCTCGIVGSSIGLGGNTLQCVCLSVESAAAYQINPILSSPLKAGHSF